MEILKIYLRKSSSLTANERTSKRFDSPIKYFTHRVFPWSWLEQDFETSFQRTLTSAQTCHFFWLAIWQLSRVTMDARRCLQWRSVKSIKRGEQYSRKRDATRALMKNPFSRWNSARMINFLKRRCKGDRVPETVFLSLRPCSKVYDLWLSWLLPLSYLSLSLSLSVTRNSRNLLQPLTCLFSFLWERDALLVPTSVATQSQTANFSW